MPSLISYFHVCFPPQLLEYTGKGKSIVDVGLAQARQPLNTRFHYYELEITDAGEKCYIALGLAGRVNILMIESLTGFPHQICVQSSQLKLNCQNMKVVSSY